MSNEFFDNDVDLAIVWNVVQNDIPHIKPLLLQVHTDYSS